MKHLLSIAILVLFLPPIAGAAFPTGWGREVEIVIADSVVDANLTDFPVLLTFDNFPAEMFAGSLTRIDGGDIRFTSDSAGTDSIAHDLVEWDTVNNIAQIWVDVASLSSSTANSIWCWYDSSGATLRDRDAVNGSEDVWSNSFLFVSHMEEASGSLIDETSNNHDFGVEGSPLFGEPGQFGSSILYDATTELHSRANTAAFDALTHWTITAWHSGNGVGTSGDWGRIFTNTNGTGSDTYHMGVTSLERFATRRTNSSNSAITIASDNTMSDSVFYLGVARANKTVDSLTIWDNVDGLGLKEEKRTITIGDPKNPGGADELGIGGHPRSSTRGIQGWIDEITVSNVYRSDGWATTLENNQRSPATFAFEGTPFDVPAAADGDISYVRRIKEGEGK